MDEHFKGDLPKKPHKPDYSTAGDLSEYLEQRSQRIKNFTLKMEEPDDYVPKFGAPAPKTGGDVFSYGKGEADRKKDDFIELSKSFAENAGKSSASEADSIFERNGIEKPVFAPPRSGFTSNSDSTRSETQRTDRFSAESGRRAASDADLNRSRAYDKTAGDGVCRPSAQAASAPAAQRAYRQTPTAAANTAAQTPHANSAPVRGQSGQVADDKTAKPANKTQSPKKAQPQKAAAPAAKKPAAPVKKTVLSKEKKQRRKKLRGYSAVVTILGFLCAIVFIASLTTAVSTVVLAAIDDILAFRDDKTVVNVTVPENAGPDEIIDLLSDAGIIRQKLICKLFAKFRHFDGYTSDETGEFVKTEYAPGIYYIEKDDGIEAILNSMKVGYGSFAETVTVSFPEGWTIEQIFEKLEKNEVCEAAVLYANLDITAQQYGFYEKIPDKATRYRKLEGYLFPDTYEFYVGENPNSVLKKLFDNFKKKWTSAYSKRAKELGMSMDEVITLASILQAEGSTSSQMKTISSILHNRLSHTSKFPLLQCDSTSTYANNYIIPNVDTYYGQLYGDAYNTYSSEGLPPGPVCNPGDDAINAALYPEDTDYYYFCHDTDGNMYVAETFEEHRVNIAKALG